MGLRYNCAVIILLLKVYSMKFTLGFVFDPSIERVLLIKKQRPAWQAGKINGVGGKLEPGEGPVEGMQRETKEESSLCIEQGGWIHVADMRADDWVVHVFTAIYEGNLEDIQSLTDEPVAWFPVDTLPSGMNTNLPWLIPLCKDRLQNGTPAMCIAEY
jgi:8-oxo-dGTP diphosphatase